MCPKSTSALILSTGHLQVFSEKLIMRSTTTITSFPDTGIRLEKSAPPQLHHFSAKSEQTICFETEMKK